MERFQKKLNIDAILSDMDLIILGVLLIILLTEGADLPLVLAIAYILFF